MADKKIFTHKTAECAKPAEKAYKISTGRGFYLFVTPKGGKLWRYDYRFAGKRKTASLGEFPKVSLKEAIDKQIAMSKMIANGIDPNTEKRQRKLRLVEQVEEQKRTFEIVAREWLKQTGVNKAESYVQDMTERLQNHIFPYIGNRPMSELETKDFLPPLRAKEDRGKIEMAHRLAQIIKRVCRYAKICGYTKHNEAEDISEALMPRNRKKHRATITDPKEIGILLNAIEDYPGDLSIKYALKILPYVFVRSGELRGARWEEINFEESQWLIPAERMKMKKAHLVPLARQVKEMFIKLKEISPDSDLIFPSFSKNKCITCEGLLTALRRIGYNKDEMCIHGFRAMASTLLNEQAYRGEVIEAQLAHAEKNSVREAYNHAQYLDERCKMMQEWADYLDKLRLSD